MPVQLTDAQKIEALRLRAAGHGWRAVSSALKIQQHSIRCAVQPGYQEYRTNCDKRRRGQYRADNYSVGHRVERGTNWNMVIPPEVLADRDRRMAMWDKPLGDPLPGYSALDKRNV